MPSRSLEVADIFRDHGAVWRAVNAGHISLNQFKVMPQSALPKMPGGCGEDMACGT